MFVFILFFYGSVLLVGAMGGWTLRWGPTQGHRPIRWALVFFPLLLAAAFLVKPHGPAFWLQRMPRPRLWEQMVVYALLVVVGIRGLWEIVSVAVDLARLRHGTISGAALAEAPWLEYEALCVTIGLHSTPEIRIHPTLRSPVVVGWWTSVILYPGRLVPRECRNTDPFWEDMEEACEDQPLIRAMIVHELAHVRQGDPIKLALLALSGCLIPWEWIVERTELKKSALTRTWLFRGISRVFRRIGQPYRWGIRAERRIQEALADAAVVAALENGGELLAQARGVARVEAFPKGSRWGCWRGGVFTLGLCGLLWVAPSASSVRYLWEGKVTHLHDLPNTWTLLQECGFSEASAGLIPGKGSERGKILVHIEELVPGHWPQLLGSGDFQISELPKHGWIEMTWDISFEDALPDQGSLCMMIAAVRMALDTQQHTVSVEADPGAPPEHLGGKLYRYRRLLPLASAQSGPTWFFLKYVFKGKGRWTFHSPVITVATPDGHRRPFPST